MALLRSHFEELGLLVGAQFPGKPPAIWNFSHLQPPSHSPLVEMAKQGSMGLSAGRDR